MGRHSDSTNTSLQTPFFHSGFLWFPKEASRRKKRKNFQRELTSNHSALNSLEGIWRCSKYLPSLRCQQVISCTILFYGLTCFLKFLWFFSHGISPYSTEELSLRYRMKGLRFRGNCFIPQLGLLLITRNKQSHWVQEKQVLRSRFRLQVRDYKMCSGCVFVELLGRDPETFLLLANVKEQVLRFSSLFPSANFLSPRSPRAH